MKTHHKNNERLVTKVFQDVFDKYDLMNDLMSLGVHRLWKKNFINWLNPQENTTLIDVASGTGDIAKLYLNKINYKGTVCCVDENKEMLNLNKKKLKKTLTLNGSVIVLKNCHLKIIILIIIQLVLVLEMLVI